MNIMDSSKEVNKKKALALYFITYNLIKKTIRLEYTAFILCIIKLVLILSFYTNFVKTHYQL